MSIVSESNDGVKCVEFTEVIKIDEGKVRQHVEEVVRQSVEETLNGLLDAEADELCGAKRYERSSSGSTPVLATTSESCTPRQARSR